MRTVSIALWLIAGLLVGFVWLKRKELAVEGLSTTGKMLLLMGPVLLCAFIIAGQLQVLLPREAVRAWLGQRTGIEALIISAVAGALTPGGPYVSLPIALALFQSGASVGCVVAYLTGWTMWGVNGLFFELSVLGPGLTLAKRLCTLPLPILAGFLARIAFDR